MGMILVTASVAVFVWAVVGLINPGWARLPHRKNVYCGLGTLRRACRCWRQPTAIGRLN